MKRLTQLLGAALLLGLTLATSGCDRKSQLVGTWHLDRMYLNQELFSVPEDASTFMYVNKDGTFRVTNNFGMAGTAKWDLDGDYFLTDDGTTKERFHIDTLSANRLVITETIEIGTQTLSLSRK